MTTSYFVQTQSNRPPLSCIAYFLWGPDAQFDSDGNALSPIDPNWTELILTNRVDEESRVDIRPVSTEPLVFEIKGSQRILAARVAYYLGMSTNGQVAYSIRQPFFAPELLEPELGDFDIEAALWNAAYL
jgi:hypothetical protein